MTFEEKMIRKYSTADNLLSDAETNLANDFMSKFKSMLEWRKEKEHGNLSLRGFERQVFALRAVWKNIDAKVKLPEFIWRKMYATGIAPIREEMFPDEMLSRRLTNLNVEGLPGSDVLIDDPQPDQICNRARSFNEYK
jgi:hypothetical protein